MFKWLDVWWEGPIWPAKSECVYIYIYIYIYIYLYITT